ncbi:unnamed protein product [Rhizoctonia solani]|uniref:Uncharacterized protein n=1 Tax=Rhizoctonia solani TaxID=456999 RepID=A0A8H2WDV1_9AGAM|nr:unnamed protein product [Rhizoctonia solani]
MAPRSRPFMQIDVFPSPKPLSGNPVAVVLDSEGLSDETMKNFASWTNLSETTFVQPATDPRADYKLRIFTPTRELPFAGHPTLGSCKAWLESGGNPKKDGEIIQECGIGLVTIKLDSSTGRLSFAAPQFLREGDVSAEDLKLMCGAMGIDTSEVLASRWIDNGPGWAGLLLKSADAVLAVETLNMSRAKNTNWGIVGAYEKSQNRVGRALKGEDVPPNADPDDDGSPHFELRAFAPKEIATIEDPVTGSLNAGVGKWLISTGLAPKNYLASQGTCLGREGRIFVSADSAFVKGGDVWIGGDARVCIQGEVVL